jgi:hypothetical protein
LNDGKTIYLNKLVLAIPPENITQLIKSYKFRDCFGNFGNFEEWAEKTDYIEYISITYHFIKPLKLPYVSGVTFDTDWGLAVINLSDYMTNIENGYNTVLSTAITICDRKSSFIHKTANQCSKEELYKEVYRQLKESAYHDLPSEYVAIMNPNIYYDNKLKKWKNIDEAFFKAYGVDHIPFQSKLVKNIYNLGTHNGHSYVPYTTIESAVSNGIALARILCPRIKPRYIIDRTINTKEILLFIVLISLIIYLVVTAK